MIRIKTFIVGVIVTVLVAVMLIIGVRDIRSFIIDETFLVRDSNGDSYSIYLDIE